MDWASFFRRPQKGSAAMAKERLQVIVAHQRTGMSDHPDYFPKLQRDLLRVIRKYVQVNDEAVRIEVERDHDMDLLELNITLPELAVEPKPEARKTPTTRAQSRAPRGVR